MDFTVKTLTMGELDALSMKVVKSGNSLQKLYNNIMLYLSAITPWSKLSAYDIYPLMFLSKLINVSINNKLSFQFACPDCKTLNTDTIDIDKEIRFQEPNEELFNIKGLLLDGTQYQVAPCSLEYFMEVLKNLMQYDTDENLDMIMLLSHLKFLSSPQKIYNAINNSIKDEIILIKYYSSFLYSEVEGTKVSKCSNCSKEVEINNLIDLLISNPFSELSENIGVPQSKIIRS